MGNHDNFRISDRLGAKYVRAINTLNLLLPGTATTYYGEELGMENIYVSYEDTQDPFAKNNPVSFFLVYSFLFNASRDTFPSWFIIIYTKI